VDDKSKHITISPELAAGLLLAKGDQIRILAM
jgi:arginine N-succinyltransferase